MEAVPRHSLTLPRIGAAPRAMVLALALAVLASAARAEAQNALTEQLATARTISDPTARLAAYDAIADSLKESTLPVPPKPPRPRPKLRNARPAALPNNPQSVSNAGALGVDAKFNEFGDYLQEFIDTVDAQWQKIVGNMTAYPPSRSLVTVRFKLNARGEITEILEVGGGEATGRPGTDACINAIRARAPYQPWTKEMVAVLGTEQVITFTFYYW